MLLRFLAVVLCVLFFPTGIDAQRAEFTISPRTGCVPMLATFSSQSTGTITSHSWDLGNTVTATGPTPSTTYNAPGIYYVRLIVNGPGGADTAVDSVIVYDGPAISFTSPSLAGCVPHVAPFTAVVTPNAPGALKYEWAFGDGYTDTAVAPQHIYETPGTFTPILKVTNGMGCAHTVVRNSYVTSWSLPVLNYLADQTRHCGFPATVNFSSTIASGLGPYSYAWDFGDGGTATGPSPSHAFNAGLFTITGIATDSRGCRDTAVAPDYISVLGTIPSFTLHNVCEDSLTMFENTTGAGGKAHWDYGDGFRDSGTIVNHIYAAPGTYTVRMTVVIDDCPKILSKNITIYPKAAIRLIQDPSYPCPPRVRVDFRAVTDIPASYFWFWDGGGDTGAHIHKWYDSSYIDTMRLFAVTEHHCVSWHAHDTIYPRLMIPKVKITNEGFVDEDLVNGMGGCVPHTTRFFLELLTNLPPASPLLQYPVPVTSWAWDFGDGGSSTLASPIHTYTDTGVYRPRLIWTTANGCTDTTYNTVYVRNPVLPQFRVANDTICRNRPIRVYNTTPAGYPAETYFYWKGAVIVPSSGSSFDSVSLISAADSFYSFMMFSNYQGCITPSIQTKRITVSPPVARFNWALDCWPSLGVQFINQTLGGHHYFWSFGDGNTDTSRNPKYTYASTGNYRPSLVSLNDTSGCIDTFVTSIYNQLALQHPGFYTEFPRRFSCAGIAVPIETKYPKFPIDDPYPWDVKIATEGDTTDWTPGTNPHSHVYRNTGKHDVVVFTRYGRYSCIDTTVYAQIIEISKPIVNFSASIRRDCVPLIVNLQDSSTNALPGTRNVLFTWRLGDGQNRVSDTIGHRYDRPGYYDITLSVTDSAGCADSLQRKGYLAAHETVASVDNAAKGFGPDTACAGSFIRFKSTSTGLTALRHHWDFGDGTTDTAIAPVHQFRSAGRYQIRLIATDSIGCADTIYRTRPIDILGPVAAFTTARTLSLCPPLQTSFSNQSTRAASYRWDFGDGSPGPVVAPNPSHTFLNAGVYQVTLVASDPGGCRDTATDTVRVLGYDGAFSVGPARVCAGAPVTFTPAVGNIPRLTWDFGDGSTDTSNDSRPGSHVYTRAGAFLPKVIFSDGQGCNALSTALDSVYVDDVVADFSWTIPCADTPFTVTSLSTASYNQPNSFQWSSPSATSPSSGSPGRLTIPGAGRHPVTLIATNAAGCADTLTKDVLINALPPVVADRDTAVCPGDTARLSASGAISYVWAASNANPGAALSCTTCLNPLAWTRTAVVYTLSGVDANGCWGRDSVTVSIQIKTTSTTGPEGEICYGESYRLRADGADTYEWYPANTLDNPSIATPVATPRTTTVYTVVSSEGSCEVDTQRTKVVVNSLPDFSAGPDKIIALGSAATLEPRGTFTRIEWLNGDTTLSCRDCRNPNAHPYYTRTYWAKATNEKGCESVDSVTVHVRCNGSQIFIPNTFTPNGDGQNDWFYPQGEGLDRMTTFRIFNRWGEMIFEAQHVALNSPSSGWDGTFKGQQLAPDTYIYTMTSRCRTGELVNFKGDVTLVR